jgi:hypothetical protein
VLLRILGLLVVVWLAFVVIGLVVKAVFWLAVVGALLFLVTIALGRGRRDRIGR